MAALASLSFGTVWLTDRKAAWDAGLWPPRKQRYWWESLPSDAAFPISRRDFYVIRYNAIVANDVNPHGESGSFAPLGPWQKFVQCTNRLVSEAQAQRLVTKINMSFFEVDQASPCSS
jgi:hypothetical protein